MSDTHKCLFLIFLRTILYSNVHNTLNIFYIAVIYSDISVDINKYAPR